MPSINTRTSEVGRECDDRTADFVAGKVLKNLDFEAILSKYFCKVSPDGKERGQRQKSSIRFDTSPNDRTSPKCYKCPKKHIGPTI